MVPIPATEGKTKVIVIGIDPHKASITAAALSPASTTLGHRRLATTAKTGSHLITWAAEWPDRLWAVEGAAGLGHGVAQQLVAAGERVVDVPARLAARARLLGSGSARKTDVTDAVSVASVAIHNPKLSVVAAEDHTVVLRLLSDRRDDVVSQRTRTMNRLQVLLRNLEPGGAPRQLSTTAAAAFLARVRPITLADQQRKSIARDLLDDLRRADRQLAALGKTIATKVAGSGTTLPEIHGVGSILAAKIIGHAGLVTRFESKNHFASYTGTAPVEASSGDIRRHRLNRAGNRQLNTALHTRGRRPGPRRRTRTRALRAQDRRAEYTQGSPAQPQAPARERRVPAPPDDHERHLSGPLLDTEALVGHFRPTGQYRVGVRAGPTDRYQDNPLSGSVSRNSLGQTWPGHPPGTLVSLTA